MQESWANPGVDLLLDLRGARGRAAVENALRDAVRGGRLAAGTPLPSSRALSAELGLARNTVADAYGQLVAEGWLTARQGSGTRVAERARPQARPSSVPPPPSGTRLRYNLTPGTPDLAGFPRTAWLSAARRAMATAPNGLFGYPDPRGHLGLRETLAAYLARVRGVRATPDQVVICSGFVQALSLLAGTLRRGGARTLAVESHGLSLHRELVRAAGLTTRPVTVDGAGARVDEFGDCDAALLTPSHQFPLGVPLAARRRAAVLEWARARGGLIIEDDYDGEFRYDRKPIGALQGLAPDLVAYAGTASKSLVPALGLAWLVVPLRLLDPVVEAKRLSDGYTGLLEQLTLDEFITSGGYDRHVRRSRLRYRRRRDQLLAALAERTSGITVTGIAAGLHAVAELDGLRAEDEPGLRTRATRAGLAVQMLSFYRHDPRPDVPAALVIGYATPPAHAYLGAIDALCDTVGLTTGG
jgi:GntR family transcriptional regulator / MocR family aminotransferase